jgi:3-oxoadipate enol-lactonase
MIFLKLGDLRFRVDISGQGPQSLVLLHELGGSLDTWSSITPALNTRFRVLAYDQRGSGQSQKVRGDFSIDDHLQDLAGLLDAAGIACAVHLAGVALGAGMAARFAARWPDKVASIVLANPATAIPAARRDYLHQRAASVLAGGMQAVIDDTLDRSYPPEIRGDGAVYATYRQRFLRNDPQSYAALNLALAGFDATQDLPHVTCPALVLGGKHDKLRPPPEVERVAAQIPGARYALIDCGHIMPVQAPAEMSRAMFAFYDDIGGAGGRHRRTSSVP